ncbi:MAG: deoxyribonuclease V [candidate division WOR-3 bacterium]|nr:deoxyribonuclease V [candidate division WOR-3 bacterium]MCX7756999.1 deoxyribonuclease V [candidate division WOR-3 bacterium]
MDLEFFIKKQSEISSRIIIADLLEEVKVVAGADCSFDEKYVYACIVVMKIDDFSVIDFALAKELVTFPYIPTFLSFREEKAIIKSFYKLKVKPDILFCDGQGIAHPRKAGLACAVGVELDIPTVGVAKNKLCGTFKKPTNTRGSFSYLYYRGEKIGIVLRSRSGVKPIFVSPGHKISLERTREIVVKTITRYRIPEPLRIAHIFANYYKQGKISRMIL